MKVSKADVLANARELFITAGYKNTSISDITKKTGIAVGSFYKYYSSKDEVFIEVFLAENELLKERILAAVDLDGDPVTVMKEVMAMSFAGISENPILREWYDRDVYSKIENYYRENEGMEEDDQSYNLMMGIIKKWQNEGQIRPDIDSEMIFAIFNTFQYIELHKDEIGSQHFPQLMDYVVEFIVNGLRNKK